MQDETTGDLVPIGELSLISSDKVSYSEIATYRQKILHLKTPSEYVRVKPPDNYPYVPSNIVDDTFNRLFPVNDTDLVSRTEDPYWIHYTVKVIVTLPNGVKISKLGSAGQRKQIKKKAKDAFIEQGTPINPFDYVDNSNADKAALSLAIKNAQERHGVFADITERLVLTPDQIKAVNEKVEQIIGVIEHPQARSQVIERFKTLKTPNEKMKFINILREKFPEVEELFNN